MFTCADFSRSSYGDYTFPAWCDVVGWCITLTEVLCVPLFAIYQLYKAGTNITFKKVSLNINQRRRICLFPITINKLILEEIKYTITYV